MAGGGGEVTLLVCLSFGSRFAAISSKLRGVVAVCFKFLRSTYVGLKARLGLSLFEGVIITDVV